MQPIHAQQNSKHRHVDDAELIDDDDFDLVDCAELRHELDHDFDDTEFDDTQLEQHDAQHRCKFEHQLDLIERHVAFEH